MIVGRLEIEMMANIARLQSDMAQVKGELAQVNSAVSRTAQHWDAAVTTMRRAFGSLGVGIGVVQIGQLADSYVKFTAQLKLATNGQKEFETALNDVRRISKTAQQDLESTGVLYARITNSTKELGASQEKVARITESIVLALKASGASASESASAMLQLSQAFASGVLRGEEFNAVNEAAPRLMKALADGIGQPIGALKKMAEEGKLTAGVLADALPKALGDLRKEADQINTISGALTVLKNNAMEMVGVITPAIGTVLKAFEAMKDAQKDASIGGIEFRDVMELIGEAIRVLALGITTIWTAIKDFIEILTSGAKMAWAQFRGDMASVITEANSLHKRLDANNDALLAFSDKALAGSKVFNNTAASITSMGNASAGAVPKMNAAATATAAQKQEAEKLQAVLDRLNGVDRQYEDSLGLLARAANTGAISMEQFAHFSRLAFEQSNAGKAALAGHKKGIDEVAEALKKAIDATVAFHDKLAEQTAELGLSEEAVLKLESRQLGLGDSNDALIEKFIRTKEALADQTKALADATAEWNAYVEAQKAITTASNSSLDAWAKGNAELAKLSRNIGLTKTQIELLTAAEQYEAEVNRAMLIEDVQMRENHLRALKRLYEERIALINGGAAKQALQDASEQEKKLAEDNAKAMADAYRRAWQAIDSTAFDVFSSILNKGEDTWKKLANTLKQTVIRMLYEMTVQRWTLNLVAQMGRVGAGTLGGGSGGTLDTVGSLLGMGSTANSISSGASTIAGWLGIGTTATTAMSSAAASATSASVAAAMSATGAEAAAIGAASAASSAAGVAAAVVPVVGWIVAAAALVYAIAGANKEPSMVRAGLSRTGPFEDQTSGTRTPFGTFGFGDRSTQQFSGQVGQAFTDAIGQLLTIGAAQLSPEAIDDVTEAINQTILMSAEGDYTTEDFLNRFGPQMARQLLDPMMDAIDPYAAQLVDEFKGPLDQFLAFVGDVLTVTGALSEKGEEFERTFGQAIDLETLNAMRGEGESFTATLNRLHAVFVSTNQIAEMMGQSQEEVWGAVGLASLEAREHLIEAAGGLDKLNASLSSYYEHYFTEEERLAMQGERLVESFQQLGVEMPKTLGGFRDLIEAQDLTTEAGRQQYAALLALEGMFHSYTTATQGATDATRDATDAMLERTESLQNDLAEADIELMRAQGQEMAALMMERSRAINGMSNEQIAYYDLIQARRAQATAVRTERELQSQLFALMNSANAVRARDRQLRMDELRLEEQRAGLAAGSLTSIQAQIDAQEDLNRTMEEFGISADKISDILRRGLLGEIDGQQIGKELGDLIVNGIRDGMINQVSSLITDDIMSQFMEPMFAAIQGGASATAAVQVAVSSGAIAAITENATAMVQGLAAVFKDPAFIDAMRQLREQFQQLGEAIGGLGTASGSTMGEPTGPGFSPSPASQPGATYTQAFYPEHGFGPSAPPMPGAVWVSNPSLPGGGYWQVTFLYSTGAPVAFGPDGLPDSGDEGTEGGSTILSAEEALARKLEVLRQIYELQGKSVEALAIKEQQRAKELAELRRIDPSGELAMFTETLWQLQDAAEAAAKAAALLDQSLEMQARIAELTGDAVLAAAIKQQQQAIALAKLDPSLRTFQVRIWELEAAAQAAAKAAEFAKTKMGLQVQLLRLLGKEEEALALERAALIAELRLQWGAQADELIAIYEQIWAAQDQMVESGSSWVKSLLEWRKALLLDDQLSPLTASQQYAEAKRQFDEIARLAAAGDKSARDRYTGAADELLRKALEMFGRASPAYQAVFQAILAQTDALIAAGQGPSAPTTLGDVHTLLDGGQSQQRARDDEALAESRAQTAILRAELTAMKTELAGIRTAVERGTDKNVEGLDGVKEQSKENTRELINAKVYG